MTICGRRPRKIRCIAALTILLAMITIFFTGLAAQADDFNDEQIQAIYVSAGDTIWGLVEEYCDYDGDIRNAIHEVQTINNIDNGDIRSGQIIYIPQRL